jgi:hypothetical protein
MLQEYIESVTKATPVFEIPVVLEKNAIRDTFFPVFKGCNVVVLEDSDRVGDPTNLLDAEVIIDQQSIDRRIEPCYQAELSRIHSEAMVEDLTDRLKSGELSDDPLVEMPESFVSRIADMLERRRIKLANEKLVWFTMREDHSGHMFLSWPLSGYMPITGGMIFHDLKVQKACTRLKNRHHIKNIQVTGSVVPSAVPVYFDWIPTE